jgi:signal transduction protein with GAF and PtsI domain
MTWDAEALIRQIQESERAVAGAMNEIMLLRERIHDLEQENQRLRTRLAYSSERMRRMEEGEL